MRSRLTRRELIVGASIGVAGAALRVPALATSDIVEHAEGWAGFRGLFDLDPSKVHMSGFFLAAHPKPVRDAIARHRAALDRNPFNYSHDLMSAGEQDTRAAAAKYLNCRAQDVALTDSTTMGLACLYGGVKIAPSQTILTTTHDHHSTHTSIEFRCRNTGVTSKRVPLYQDSAKASATEIVASLEKAIDSSTRVLAVTYVHSSTGVRLPIALIAEVVQKANAGRADKDRLLLFVDAVHGFGSTVIDTSFFGADAFAAGCHKWLFGPRGTGLLWARPEVQGAIAPIFPSFSAGNGWGLSMTPGGFHSFEHRWALKEAFELHNRLGAASVQARIHELNRHAKEELAKMPKVKLYTPLADELSAGIICFDIDHMRQTEVVSRLAGRGIIASVTPYAESYARISPGLLNNEVDVERTLAFIHELAR